jgi:tRNA(Ile)-lysidine synthase
VGSNPTPPTKFGILIMLIKLLPHFEIPRNVGVAFSGGIDSLAIAHFLKKGNREVTLFHFNHGCEYSDRIQDECEELARKLQLPILVRKNSEPVIPAGESKENHWRKMRYQFLRSFYDKIITGHHLSDAVETWVWSSLHGDGKIIPAESGNIIRPFLLTPKRNFEEYCSRHNLIPVHDPYNEDYSLPRNLIRHKMMPLILQVNPGIEKVIAKKYTKLYAK